MSNYEGMFLLDHGKVKGEAQKGIEEVTRIIEKYKGSIVQIGRWDERRLAYEINGQKRGVYILAHFSIDGQQIVELNRDFNLNEIVSRHLVTSIETEFPEFLTAQDLENRYGSREFRDRGRRGPGRGDGGGRRDDGDSYNLDELDNDDHHSMSRR